MVYKLSKPEFLNSFPGAAERRYQCRLISDSRFSPHSG